MKFPINPACTAGYNWRNMASNKNKQSYHSYGSVIDVNWEHNGATYTGWPYKPGERQNGSNQKGSCCMEKTWLLLGRRLVGSLL